MSHVCRIYEDLHPELSVCLGSVLKAGRFRYESITEVWVPERIRSNTTIALYLSQEAMLMNKLSNLKYNGKSWQGYRIELDNLRHDIVEHANRLLNSEGAK